MTTETRPIRRPHPGINIRSRLARLVRKLPTILKWLLILTSLATLEHVASHNIHGIEHNTFNPGITALYNTSPNMWIFRGNTPTSSTHVAYKALETTLRKKAQAAGHPLPTNFRITDVSLLRSTLPFYEAIQLHAEKSFFKKHPAKGTAINAPLNLTTTNKKEHYNYHEVLQAVNAIHQATLLASRTHPAIIYVHCEHGIDRTGAVLAAYDVLFQNMKPSNAIKKANEESKMKNNAAYTVYHVRHH